MHTQNETKREGRREGERKGGKKSRKQKKEERRSGGPAGRRVVPVLFEGQNAVQGATHQDLVLLVQRILALVKDLQAQEQ